MNDREIVELYWQRSERAIEETIGKYGSYCRYIAANILSDENDCEECVQDALTAAWNSIPPQQPKRFMAVWTMGLGIAVRHEQARQHV